jgi:hypothetical protein
MAQFERINKQVTRLIAENLPHCALAAFDVDQAPNWRNPIALSSSSKHKLGSWAPMLAAHAVCPLLLHLLEPCCAAAHSRSGPILLKKDFEGDPRVILIQDEPPTSKIDSKTLPLGFDYFEFLFHSLILDTFSTVSVNSGKSQTEHIFSGPPRKADPHAFPFAEGAATVRYGADRDRIADIGEFPNRADAVEKVARDHGRIMIPSA